MAKRAIIVFLFMSFFKAESQSFGALPYLDNNIIPYYIENVLWDSIHDKLLVSSKWCNYAGGKKVRGICSWNGSAWDSLKGGLNTHDVLNNQPNSTIWSGIPYNGKFLVGGTFQSVGGINATSLATWDGNVWDSLPIRAFKFLDYGASVFDFINYNHKLFLCGSFDTIQGQKAYGLAAYDGISFQPVNIPFINNDPFITCMSIYNNELYVGGNFYTTNSALSKDIYKFNGSSWVDVGGSIKGSASIINSMVTYKNELYVAGYFLKADGNKGNIIMKWDGTNWKDAGWGNAYNNGSISKLLVHHNKLYAFGTFDVAANRLASKVAVFDGIQWCTFSDSLSQSIFSAGVYHDTIYVAGGFRTIDNDTTKKLIAKLIYPANFNHCENVGLYESNISESIKLYPNPANSTLHISNEQNELQGSTLDISNSIGQTVMQMPFDSNIDVSNLPTGCYFMTITTSRKAVFHTKFIKE